MDQEKIGKFISELRKEQEMTQQQLADTIGVSNKTISKWECGKGAPELSSIMPLCQTLQINVNELLSGERLPEDGYSKKAEENMMNLIQETEISKKKNSNSLSIIFVTVTAVLLGFLYTVITSMGLNRGIIFLDCPTILIMLVVTILFLLGTKLVRPFLQAFTIVTGRKKEVSDADILQSNSAIKLVSNTLLGIGILESIIGFIAISWIYMESPFPAQSISASIAVALLGILYGLIGFLLLLPIRIKLESMCSAKIITVSDN
ncbi:MAG: helix-turn-helix transcriptional regulator [Lachnospiraceae bacterium]|nr:helix-turn-helix transcriptional regulator [Lachnospiraceae bacterium]